MVRFQLSGRSRLLARTLLFAKFRLRRFAGWNCFQNPDLRRPFLRAVQANLAVFRVRCDLLAVILSAAAALAAGVAAHRLSRLIFRWLEDPLTVAAAPFDHTAVVASCEGDGQVGDLETAIAWVLHPGRWHCQDCRL